MCLEAPPGPMEDWAPATGPVHDVHGDREDPQRDAEQREQVQVENVLDKKLLSPGEAVGEVAPVDIIVGVKICFGISITLDHDGQENDGVNDQIEVGRDEEDELGALCVVQVRDGEPAWHHGLYHLISIRLFFSQIKETKKNKEQNEQQKAIGEDDENGGQVEEYKN